MKWRAWLVLTQHDHEWFLACLHHQHCPFTFNQIRTYVRTYVRTCLMLFPKSLASPTTVCLRCRWIKGKCFQTPLYLVELGTSNNKITLWSSAIAYIYIYRTVMLILKLPRARNEILRLRAPPSPSPHPITSLHLEWVNRHVRLWKKRHFLCELLNYSKTENLV